MMISTTIRSRVCRWALRQMQRDPDLIISDDYLHRWYVLPRNRWLNIYLHRYYGSDNARALHDHPWWSLSWMLRGRLGEVDDHGKRWINAGQWRLRRARYSHRLIVVGGDEGWPITLFITGPRLRDWGFHCPHGWVHWRRYTEQGGCGD